MIRRIQPRAALAVWLVAGACVFLLAHVWAAGLVELRCTVTIVASPDADQDGLTDASEAWLGTDPNNSDTDGDGMPDEWEYTRLLCPTNAVGDEGPDGDPDGDRFPNLSEYCADTYPRDQGSCLRITGIRRLGEESRIDWQGGVLATQTVEYCENLQTVTQKWDVLCVKPQPTPINNFATDEGVTNRQRFYRITVER